MVALGLAIPGPPGLSSTVMRTHKLLLSAVLATLLGFAPLISVLLASAATAAFGCKVGHGEAHACLVGGVDIAPALVSMGMFGWYMLLTWPLLGLAALLWAIWVVRWFLRRLKSIVSGAPDPNET